MVNNKSSVIAEVFSAKSENESIRLGWEDIYEKFHSKQIKKYDEFILEVEKLKKDNKVHSIWFTPNASNSDSHTARDITKTNWVYVDIDDINTEDFKAQYKFLLPTYVVATGHGLQLYWKLKQPVEMPNEEWKAIEKAIELKFNGEKGEIQALLRVPGTINKKHLLGKHRKKGYKIETKCEIIESNDTAYIFEDFKAAGLDTKIIENIKTKNGISKLSEDDLLRIRKHCPVFHDIFTSIELDNAGGKVGHYKRLAVANIIKHTVDSEDYILNLFKNLEDFNKAITIKHYRSITYGPITCDKLQKQGLCKGQCQLMKDINRKSPVVFAYRNDTQLKLTDDLLNNIKVGNNSLEVSKRVKEIVRADVREKLIDRIKLERSLSKSAIEKEIKSVDTVDELRPYIINHKINNLKAAEIISEKNRLMRYEQDFYQYSDGIWNVKKEEDIEAMIHNAIDEFSNNYTVKEIVNAIKRGTLVSKNKVEDAQNTYKIAVSNGMLNVRTRELLPLTRGDYRFKKMKADYDPNADCPEFKSFMKEIFLYDDDADDKYKLAQEISGYLLITDYTLIKKMFYFFGRKADNGKSSLLNIIKSVIGEEYFGSVPMNKLDGFLLQKLRGLNANIVGDESAYVKVPDGVFKSLVGGQDEVTADVKFKDSQSFVNTARLIFAVNKLPYSGAKDEGYFSRCIILIFNNQFLENPNSNDNRQMQARVEKINFIINNEKEGILNWMLTGLDRVITNKKLTIPNSSAKALEKYKKDNNSVLLYVEDKCDLDDKKIISKAELYCNYKNWCQYNGFQHYVNAKTFADTLLYDFNISEERHDNRRIFRGIWSDVSAGE